TADRCGGSGPSPSWPPAPGPGWSRWRWARPAGPASGWRRPPAPTAGPTRSGPRRWRRRSRTCGSSRTPTSGPGACGAAASPAGARAGLVPRAVGAAGRAGELGAAAARRDGRLDEVRAPVLAPAVADMREQLHRLVRPGFVRAAGLARLADIGRYLEGIRVRL